MDEREETFIQCALRHNGGDEQRLIRKEETEAYRGVCLRARLLRQNSSRSRSSSSNGVALPAVNRPLTGLIRLPHSLPSADDSFHHSRMSASTSQVSAPNRPLKGFPQLNLRRKPCVFTLRVLITLGE